MFQYLPVYLRGFLERFDPYAFIDRMEKREFAGTVLDDIETMPPEVTGIACRPLDYREYTAPVCLLNCTAGPFNEGAVRPGECGFVGLPFNNPSRACMGSDIGE